MDEIQCRSPRTKRSVSYESLEKFIRCYVARFLNLNHFGAKTQKSSKIVAFEPFLIDLGMLPQKLESFDGLRIMLEMHISKFCQVIFYS